MNGVLLVDKPVGCSSAAVVARVQRAVGARRAGHAGTLDPLASGLLVVCLGEATKLAAFLHADDKEYVAVARLGVATATLDAEGAVTARQDASGLEDGAIVRAVESLRGALRQRPPMYSAVRKNGRRLYELARAGKEVEREAREVHIEAIAATSLERVDQVIDVGFRVACSKGTYVRSLAEEIGARLGVGAHLRSLRRLRAGVLTIDRAMALEAIERAGAGTSWPLLEPAAALIAMPAVRLDDERARRLRSGQTLRLADLGVAHAGPTRALSFDGGLIAVCEADAARGVLRVVRAFHGQTHGETQGS